MLGNVDIVPKNILASRYIQNKNAGGKDMAIVEHKGSSYDVDEDGFIQSFEEWNKDWVDYVKGSEGIEELTDEHWKVINVLQDYYKKNGIAPMVRILSKVTGYKLKYIYELFPSGPGKGACKMAGLPKPTGCV